MRGRYCLRQPVEVLHRNDLALRSEHAGKLDLMVVNRLSETLETRGDNRNVTAPQSAEDAAGARVANDDVGLLHAFDDLREAHEGLASSGDGRGNGPVLDEQKLTGKRVQGAHESLEGNLSGADRREDHETLPRNRALGSAASEGHWTKKASTSG